MTVPTPRSFSRTCDKTIENITRRINDLRVLYCGELPDNSDGAYAMSLEKSVRGSAGKIHHGMSDPTLEVVGDPLDKRRPGAHAALRKKLESANTRMQELENILTSLEGDIRHAMDRHDPAETFELTRYPITVTREELRESKEAQERRRTQSA